MAFADVIDRVDDTLGAHLLRNIDPAEGTLCGRGDASEARHIAPKEEVCPWCWSMLHKPGVP